MRASDEGLRAARAHAYENPRPEVVAMVPGGVLRVLDLGCASGALGAALKARDGCEVVGVEGDHAYAVAAGKRLDRVVEADLETADLDGLGRFDCVVAADVLEHLREPWTVLARAVGLLDHGGVAVVSLPNARHWEVLWQIGARGTFPRRSQGIFDATHLRWFCLRDAWLLLDEAGLAVEEVRRVGRLRPEGEPDSPAARAMLRTPLRSFATFQHVIRGRRR